MKVLVDSDLILVACLNLGNCEKEVELLWDMIEFDKIEAYITEFGLSQILYLITEIMNTKIAEEVFIHIGDTMKILPIDKSLYNQARKLNLLDFNSALEIVTAIANDLDAVVTLTPDYFITSSTIKVVSIIDLVREYLESSYDHELKDTTIASYLPSPKTSLTQWVKNVFDSNWHSLEQNSIISRLGFRACDPIKNIKRYKLIHFPIKIEIITVILLINITPQNDKKIRIIIEVHPIEFSKYLPSGLQMTILDEFESSLKKIISRGQDNHIQCELVGGYEECFSIKLSLEGSTFIENFIV